MKLRMKTINKILLNKYWKLCDMVATQMQEMLKCCNIVPYSIVNKIILYEIRAHHFILAFKKKNSLNYKVMIKTIYFEQCTFNINF